MHAKVNDELNIANKVKLEALGLTPQDKTEIMGLIQEAIKIFGSARAVANKCGVSEAAISLIAKNQYHTQGEDMWRKVAAGIGWRKKGWVTVETTNHKIAMGALTDAKAESMFLAISYCAGSGKTTAIRSFIEQDKTANTFTMECWETWGQREFLIRLRLALGLAVVNSVVSTTDMLQQIIYFLQNRPGKPILIIDQANSSIAKICRFFIPIYNALEDKVSVVLAGTDNLEKEIKNGVRYDKKGYDEIDSRLGRNFVHMVGNTKADVKKICAANGITDAGVQTIVWNECGPTLKTIEDGDDKVQIRVIEDGRRIKRVIQKHIMLKTFSKMTDETATLSIAKSA